MNSIDLLPPRYKPVLQLSQQESPFSLPSVFLFLEVEDSCHNRERESLLDCAFYPCHVKKVSR